MLRNLEIADSTYSGTVTDYPVIVAVIPAYNEERFIASVVLTTLQYTPHVIVVNDASTDRTSMLARLAGADVVDMPENGGKGKAINAGFEQARRYSPDVVVMLDADAQHDPAEIPQIVRPIVEDAADVVVGSRFLETRSDIPKWRQAGQHALTMLTNQTSGVSMTDSQSGYRAFAAHALDQLRFQTSGLAMESEMQFRMERSGLRMAEVPISVSYRDGNKRNPVVHGLEVVEAILSLVARRRPLMFIGVPGGLLAALGTVVGLLVVSAINNHHPVPLGTAVLSSLLIVIGILLAATGLILNTMETLLNRMGVEMQEFIARAQRPAFIERKEI